MSTWISTFTRPSVTNEQPTDRDLARIDIAVIALVVFALFLGFGIRNNAATASRTVELGEGLPSIEIPSNWITGTDEGEGMLLYARNPRSPSAFNAEVAVTTHPLAAGEDVVAARTAVGLKRSQELFRYRELEAQAVTVDGTPGVLVTYAYIADPMREQGATAPPVVVQGQDLIFPSGENQALIVTIATDASTWEEEGAFVRLIQDSLNLRFNDPEIASEGPVSTDSDSEEGLSEEEFDGGGQ